MSIGGACMRVLAGVTEPAPGGVAFETGQLAGVHDLHSPHLRHRHRQQQARARACGRVLGLSLQPAHHVARQLPLGPDVARHQINRPGAGKADILRDAGRIEDAEARGRNRAARSAEHHDARRRIKAEFRKVCSRKLLRRNFARRLGDVHEPQAEIDVRGNLGRQRNRAAGAVDRPPAGFAAQRDAVAARPHFDACDFGRGGRDQALVGSELNQAAELRRMAADDQQGDERDQEHGRKRRRNKRTAPFGQRLSRGWLHRRHQRRLHQTSTPHRSVESGSSTSRTMNTSRICRLVSTISDRL